MKRKIAKLIKPREFEIIEEEIKPLKNNEVLIEIVSCGLCHSEMEVYEGKRPGQVFDDKTLEGYELPEITFPLGLGHEPTGKIIDKGNLVTKFQLGDKISGPASGAFASHITMDGCQSNLIKVPQNVTLKYALAEPLMCISNIIRQATPEFGEYVMVIGCGFMGLLTICGIASNKIRELIAVDILDWRLNLAKKYGATEIINPKNCDFKNYVQEITHGHGVDVVIEITGKLSTLDLALKAIRICRGKILIPSFYGNPEKIDVGFDLMIKAPILISAHPAYSTNYMEDLHRGMWGYEVGIFPMDELITHSFSLEDINKAFKVAKEATSNIIKAIITP
jgi:L-iditol 2-dehydrogenase